jgi:hypothetical protein
LTLVVNLTKLFSLSLMKEPNKLECLYLASLSTLVYYLQVRLEATQKELHTKGELFALPANIRHVRTWLTMTHCTFLWYISKNSLRKFYQGILKGEVTLYCWRPVWLVWISLFCKQKQILSVVILWRKRCWQV